MSIDGLATGCLPPASYKTAAWLRARAAFLAQPENALCPECKKTGRLVPAREVHHTVPHRGDREIFWDRSLWVGLCRRHHTRHTDREIRQRHGHSVVERPGCGPDGLPRADAAHHWTMRSGDTGSVARRQGPRRSSS